MKLLKLLVVLLCIFSISVFLRIPHIEKEVSPYNETYVTIFTVFENWHSQGIANCYFTPVLTWQKDGDKFIANYKRLEDKKGNNYYVSYPPFSFLFPYAISSVLDIEPGQVFIQILNIILHFISAFFIYLIICRYCKCHYSKICPAALIGFISYTFIPVLLYMHTFDFFPEMLGQVFFIIGIYLYQLLDEKKDKLNNKLLFLFGFNLFIMIYTEWIGIFFAFTLLMITISKFKKDIFFRKLSITVILVSFLALALIIFQFGYINGIGNLARSLSLRFLERSGFFGEHYSDLGISYNNSESYLLLLRQLHHTLMGFGYLFIILLIWWLVKNKFLVKKLFFGKTLLIIIVLPIIFEFFIFFNATLIHYICWAKFGIPISIGTALLIHNLTSKSDALKKINTWSIGVFIVLILTAILAFQTFKTHAEQISQKDDRLNYYGSVVKQYSSDYESIFISLPKEMKQFNTYLCFISKRNMINAESLEEVNNILKEKHKVKGVFYTFDARSKLYSVKHIDLTTIPADIK